MAAKKELTNSDKEKLIAEILSTAPNPTAVKKEPEEEEWKKNHRVMKEIIQEKLEDLESLLKGFYGEENVDFQYQDYGSLKGSMAFYDRFVFENQMRAINVDSVKRTITFKRSSNALENLNTSMVHVFIKIPLVELKSEDGTVHKMYDCYVKTQIYHDLRTISARFYRGKRTVAERSSNYLFSHCPSRSEQSSRGESFCFGEDTSMRILLSLISNESYKEDETNMFYLGFKDYLSFESVSGGPHIRVSGVRNPMTSSNRPSETMELRNNIYKAFIANFPEIEFNEVGSRLTISSDLDLWKKISSVTPAQYLYDYDPERNTILNINTDVNALRIWANDYNRGACSLFVFKGSTIRELAFVPEDIVQEESVKMCSDGIKSHVVNVLTTKLNHFNNKQFHEYKY